MGTNLSIAQKMADMLSPLSEPYVKKLSTILTRRELKKGQFLLQEGQLCRQICFVQKGLIRHYYYKNEKELTVHFVREDQLSVCLETFIHQPTRLYIEAMEPTTVYEVSYKEFMELVKESYEIGRMYQRILEILLLELYGKIESYRFESAVERYVRFRRLHPDLILRLPKHHIASYLQMSPETLSRIRTTDIDK